MKSPGARGATALPGARAACEDGKTPQPASLTVNVQAYRDLTIMWPKSHSQSSMC